MLRRAEKETLIETISRDLDKAAGVLFLDFTGLTVLEANEFRRKLQADEISYQVVKNTFMERALADKPFASASACLKGTPTGVVFGWDDPVQSAKAVFDFIKTCDHLQVKGGVVESKSINGKEAEALSKMPSKGEVQASIVQLALSPGRMIAGQLKNPAGRILGAIEALVDRLGGGESET